MPTRVYLLRHGESADPTVFHGAESDIGLSQRGREQAEAVAAYLAGVRPHVLISSAMRRARDSALPIAGACGLTLIEEPDLHERRVGAMSGMPFARTEGIWPQTLARWTAGQTDYAPPGAESFDDVKRRVLAVWERITATHRDKTLVVVAHGFVCKVLLITLLELFPIADWNRIGPIRNLAITELLNEGNGWRALRVNDEVARCGHDS
ncbi:MAG: histidine phosphatase family protein [Planctomycetes bacterium]|nr:histidine phosphatase family protein [Planctomycetota bacterium]